MTETHDKSIFMDMSHAKSNLWLVKVPNYVASQWANAPEDMTVATLCMESPAAGKIAPTVKMILSPELLQLSPDKIIASQHEVKLFKPTKGEKVLGVFGIDDETAEAEMDGWIAQKMECLPICDDQYLKMKQKAVEMKNTARCALPLQNIVASYKPVSDHVHNEGDGRRRRESAYKLLSKEAIMELLFQAFEKHQYYTLRDLVVITKQSVYLLKSILRDIGEYNKNPGHRFMWELKEEYRHYQNQQAAKTDDANK